MQVKFVDSIERIGRERWNQVAGTNYPFTRYEFLHALEVSGATDRESGWQPHHLVVYESNSDQPIALMPLYLKYHSYGEYVFDWSWADAYAQHNVEYYPKFVNAIPFTPATGPRLCIKAGTDEDNVYSTVATSLIQQAESLNVSSIHILFPTPAVSDRWQELGLNKRRGAQYHWYNHNFTNFDDFLSTFSSRKRKNLNKERKRVEEQSLRLEVLQGPDISPEIWQRFYYFYQLTYAKRSGHGGYLGQNFFELIATTMAEHLVLVLAYDQNRGDEVIAGALNFKDDETLYGRYWGCMVEYEFLHFEACYYQGIEYCIANKLRRFDPGAQGEHKIQRGFTPTETWSNHWIAHPEFSAAINDFLLRDNASVDAYIEQAQTLLPFKKSDQ
ncbi:hypothetical protein GP2143_15231 [marine gamma proteobacterium HTCC2143]|jgi:predicted N-acyltransferase|uniref:Uncharacterized protein n=1 Tax=marine gamma proteobacterium HTCC2143 TaxID=247633 RepID=A0Y916_9GAMM|nr:hypothetical protein GP2143_15231 [marine gamma proteobacterium HTCC2143]